MRVPFLPLDAPCSLATMLPTSPTRGRELRGENVELRVQLLKLHDGAVHLKQVTDTVVALQRTVADLVQELRAQRTIGSGTNPSNVAGPNAGPIAGAAAGLVGAGTSSSIPNPLASHPLPAPVTSMVDDAVARALFKKRVADAIQAVQTDNSPEVFAKGVSALEMVLGNVVKNPLVPR